MTIYIDLLFLINFSADYIILSIVNCRKGHNRFRKILISFIAGIYACFYPFYSETIFYNNLFKIVFYIGMITAIMIPCSKKEYLRGIIKGLFFSSLMCGIIYSILYALGITGIKDLYKLPTLIIFAGFVISYIVYKVFLKLYEKDISMDGYTLAITYNKKRVVLSCKPDTGNALSDPISNYPVIVADKTILKKIFGRDVSPVELCELVKPEKFKTISYKTISGTGIMFGFIPDKVTLNSKKISKIILAFAPEKLSSDALINPLTIKEG